jgi:hypothetical protein
MKATDGDSRGHPFQMNNIEMNTIEQSNSKKKHAELYQT